MTAQELAQKIFEIATNALNIIEVYGEDVSWVSLEEAFEKIRDTCEEQLKEVK